MNDRVFLFPAPETKHPLYNTEDDSSKPAEKWEEKVAFVDRVTDGFGKIQFIKEGLGGHKPAKVNLFDDNQRKSLRHCSMIIVR